MNSLFYPTRLQRYGQLHCGKFIKGSEKLPLYCWKDFAQLYVCLHNRMTINLNANPSCIQMFAHVFGKRNYIIPSILILQYFHVTV